MNDGSVSRGYWAMKEVMDKVTPYGTWLDTNRPNIHVITLKRGDYDLLARWPNTAKQFGVEVKDGVVTWKRFTLAYDKKPARYKQKDAHA